MLDGGYDAIITNAAGCGSTLKEYGELLEDDAEYAGKGRQFSALMKDVTEFLAAIELNGTMGPVNAIVTYQDSCHLAHGQRVRTAPRKLLAAVPGLTFRRWPAPISAAAAPASITSCRTRCRCRSWPAKWSR